jgi:hypothetical protein
MVLLPGCACCGCVYPLTASTTSVEVTVESTGTDVYWAYGLQSSSAFCACSAAGDFTTRRGGAAYKPPAGVFSLSSAGSGLFFYNQQDMEISVQLSSTGATRFSLASYAVGTRTLFTNFNDFCHPSVLDFGDPAGSLGRAYRCDLSQSCVTGDYSCAASRVTSLSGFPLPSVSQCPAPGSAFAEFSLATYAAPKNVAAAEASHNALTGNCSPPTRTDWSDSGTPDTVYASSFKITSIKVLYSGGAPALELLS